jgi:hypothetical protein
MEHRFDDDGRAWIQGGTARIPAPGEPGGGPVVFDDTPPELMEHQKREEDKDVRTFRANHTAQLYGDHYSKFAEARKTMNLADARGLTERSLKAFDADFLARAKSAPSDEARQGFVDDAMDLRRALETQFGMTESTFKDMERRSDLELQAAALSRQAQAYPEDYALHAAVLDKVADGAAPLVKSERAIQFRRFEAEKMAREVIRRMPDNLKNPRAVLWDKKKGNLVYVFDVPGTRKGKYVINVGFVQEVQRGDKLVRRQGNFVSSGGAVPRRILSDTNAYELVDGRI